MTPVAVLSRAGALSKTALSLGLPEESATLEGAGASNALLAQAIRRSVFIAAPCSMRTTRTVVTAALASLTGDAAALEVRVAGVIEDLVATGDLLEMRADGPEGTDMLLRPAPPAFVKRKDGTFILLGVAGDEITPVHDLPVAFRPSGLRTLTADAPETCRRALLDLGLIELPENLWLHAPAATAAESFLNLWTAKLPSTNNPETIEGLEILDTAAPSTFYKGRWKPLNDKHAGIFVARRPQRYGASLWCLVDVRAGVVQRFIDIHSKDARIRDCDEAWRIQAALDAVASAPQRLVVSPAGEKATLSFTSPLPAWAVRRLNLIGERVAPPRALLGFELPIHNKDDEVRWLQQMLWLTSEQGGEV